MLFRDAITIALLCKHYNVIGRKVEKTDKDKWKAENKYGILVGVVKFSPFPEMKERILEALLSSEETQMLEVALDLFFDALIRPFSM